MKILWVTTFYPPLTNGVAKISKLVCEELVKRGHKVVVHTLKNCKAESYDYLNGVHVFRHPFKRLHGYRYSAEMEDAVKQDNDCDVIHAHHWGYHPMTCAANLACESEIPMITNAYYHPPILGGLFRKIARLFFTKLINPYVFKNTVVPLAITKLEKKQLEDMGAGENVQIIPAPVDIDKYSPGKQKRGQILFCGVMNEMKGFDRFLKLAEDIHKRWPWVSIKVIGAYSNVKFSAHDYPYIYFRRRLTDEQLIEEYQSSIALVSPSRYESFGLVIAECMACGTPVVSLRNGSIPEVVGNTGYLYEDDEWEDMIWGVKALLDPITCKKKSEDARFRIVQKCRKEKIVDQLEALYKKVSR